MDAAQSPINLDSSTAQIETSSDALSFELYDLVTKETTVLKNNGHAIELELTSIETGAAMMSGGPLTNTYELLQLHFHWGSDDTQGSEHTVDGKQFRMEMHLVHKSSDLEWGVESATDPDVEDGLAVAAFLWEISEEDNAELTPIIEKLTDLVNYDSETELDEDLHIPDLIVSAISGSYYSYRGSLTTPSCNEVVHWIVFTTPLTISNDQLEELRKVKDSEGSQLENNYRPLQDLNGRIVTLYA